MSQLQFINSDEEYSIKDFYEMYKNDLPKLVKVTQGYCGEVSLETFDRDQVFRIHTYSVQKRVVAELMGGTNIAGVRAHFISLPVKYNMMFCVVKSGQKSGKDETLENILDKHKLPFEIEFSKTRSDSKIKIGSMERSSSQVVRLRLTNTYEDYYLLGNAVSEGSIYGKVSAMPVHLPDLRLSLVTGLQEPFSDLYDAILSQMSNQVEQHIKFDPHFGNEDIAVYSPEEVENHVNYAYVPPTDYYDLTEIFTDRPKSKREAYEKLQIEQMSSENIYDIIPADTSVYETVTPWNSASTSNDDRRPNRRKRKPPPPVLPKRNSDAEQSLKSTPVIPNRGVKENLETFQDLQLKPSISFSSEKQIRKLPQSTRKSPVVPPKPRIIGQPVVAPLRPKPPIPRESKGENMNENQQDIKSEAFVVSNMSIEDVGEWLVKLKLEKYVEDFEENQIDGTILLELNEEILKESFNMKRLEILKLMKFARTGYLPKSRAAPSSNV